MNESIDAGARSLQMSPTIKALAVALIAAQGELPKLSKDKTNPFFNSSYAGLDTVLPAALKVLTTHGLGLIQSVGEDSRGGTTLTTILMHESGEWLSDTQPLLLTKTDPQGQGSAITYGRRYAVMSMLGLVADDDDDGNAASKAPVVRRAAPSAQPSDPSAPRKVAGPSTDSGELRMKAKYRGNCSECGQPIEVGDDMVFVMATKQAHHDRECLGSSTQKAPPEAEDGQGGP